MESLTKDCPPPTGRCYRRARQADAALCYFVALFANISSSIATSYAFASIYPSECCFLIDFEHVSIGDNAGDIDRSDTVANQSHLRLGKIAVHRNAMPELSAGAEVPDRKSDLWVRKSGEWLWMRPGTKTDADY